jgi:hypothetical protein
MCGQGLPHQLRRAMNSMFLFNQLRNAPAIGRAIPNIHREAGEHKP